MSCRRSGYTLAELLMVVVIIGIMVAIVLPRFGKTLEATKAQTAEAALQQILAGEKMYRAEEGYYYPAGTTKDSIATINTDLRLFLDASTNRAWDYAVTAADNPPGNTFTATATRRGGRNNDETITIDQDGNLGGTWTP